MAELSLERIGAAAGAALARWRSGDVTSPSPLPGSTRISLKPPSPVPLSAADVASELDGGRRVTQDPSLDGALVSDRAAGRAARVATVAGAAGRISSRRCAAPDGLGRDAAALSVT